MPIGEHNHTLLEHGFFLLLTCGVDRVEAAYVLPSTSFAT